MGRRLDVGAGLLYVYIVLGDGSPSHGFLGEILVDKENANETIS